MKNRPTLAALPPPYLQEQNRIMGSRMLVTGNLQSRRKSCDCSDVPTVSCPSSKEGKGQPKAPTLPRRARVRSVQATCPEGWRFAKEG